MKINLSKTVAALAALACLNAYAAPENSGMNMGDMNMNGMKMNGMNMDKGGQKDSGKAKVQMAEGEVKALDRAGKTITIKHGPIRSKTVEMGPMTMSFPVKSASLLTPAIKEGSKVRFQVENVEGGPTVVALKAKS